MATLLDRGSQFLAMPRCHPPHASALFFGPLGHLLVVQLTSWTTRVWTAWSTYAWIFSVEYYSAEHSGWLKLQMGTAVGSVELKDFQLKGVGPVPNLHWFKGQL